MGINNMIFSTFCENTYTYPFFVMMDTILYAWPSFRIVTIRSSRHSVSDLTQRKLLSNNNGPRIAYQIFLPTLCNFSVLFDYFFVRFFSRKNIFHKLSGSPLFLIFHHRILNALFWFIFFVEKIQNLQSFSFAILYVLLLSSR